MEDKDGVADDAGASDGTIQCTGDRLGQDRGITCRQYEMAHGTNHGATTETRIGDFGGVLQRPLEENAKHVGRGTKLDANDQTEVDKLHGTRNARKQRADDTGSDLVVQFIRNTETKRRGKTCGARKGDNKMVGMGKWKGHGEHWAYVVR